VSVVRFRPGPPRIRIAHLLGYFLFNLSKVVDGVTALVQRFLLVLRVLNLEVGMKDPV
jgi:hypothetical protein